MSRIRTYCLLFLSFFAVASPASGETNVGVRTFIPATPEHELLSRQVQAVVNGELTRMLLEAQQTGKCDVGIFDISAYNIETRDIEKGLQESGITDQKTAIPIEQIPVNTFVDGVVGMSGGEVDFMIDVAGMDGKSTIKMEGSFREEDLLKKGEEIARSLLEKLCPMKPYRVQGGMNDLVINQTVCDVTKSFVLHGSGATAGISLTLAPSSEKGGDFAVSGTAGGVRWSGGGTYKLALNDGGGMLNLSGSWKISTPMGNFPGGGTIKTKLTPADDCKQPPPAPPKVNKKKKKK